MASPQGGNTEKKRDQNHLDAFISTDLTHPELSGLSPRALIEQEVRDQMAYDLKELFDRPPVINEYNIGISNGDCWGKLANTVLSDHKNLCKYLGERCERCKKIDQQEKEKAQKLNNKLANQDKYRRSKALRNLKGKESKFSNSLPRKSITIKHNHIKMLAPEIKEQLEQLKKKNNKKQLSEERNSICRSRQNPKLSRQSISTSLPDVKKGDNDLLPERRNSIRKKPTFRNSTGHGDWNFNTIKEVSSPVKSPDRLDSMHTTYKSKDMSKQKPKRRASKLKKIASKHTQNKAKDAEQKINDFLQKIEATKKKPPILGYKVTKHSRNKFIFKGSSTDVLKRQTGTNKQEKMAQDGLIQKMKEFKKLSNLSPEPYRLKNAPKAKASGYGDMNPKTLKEVLFTIKNDIESKIKDIQTKEIEKPLFDTEKFFKNQGKYKLKSFSPKRKGFNKKGLKTSRNQDEKKIKFLMNTFSPKKLSLSQMKQGKTCLDRGKKSLKPAERDNSLVLPAIQSPRSAHSEC
ncbi:unnamed protein product [Moneuplotes crassus]|uniref:Uncharacterized protein n=1 Tax=Euplotes crassus TaxID=5936 RepID=A0AAD1U2I1_EUPCR|nr:unnamed protein product [Moneuplotes crassus]